MSSKRSKARKSRKHLSKNNSHTWTKKDSKYANSARFLYWNKNDLCFCDSKKYIFDCCLEQFKSEYFTNRDALLEKILQQLKKGKKDEIRKKMIKAEFRDENKKYKCLIDGCNDFAINSHIVPKNLLKLISNKFKNVKIFHNEVHNKEMEKTHFLRDKTPGTIAEKLFCHNHDMNLFKSVDQTPFDLSDKKNLKLVTIRAAYNLLRAKEKRYVGNLKNFLIEEPLFALIPNVIDTYKGGLLGCRDIQKNIIDIMNDDFNFRAIYGLVESKVLFASWSYHIPIKYTSDYSDIKKYRTTKEMENYISPAIITIAFPWKEKNEEVPSKMFYISLFTKHDELEKEFKYVKEELNNDLQQRWVLSNLPYGDQFWIDEESKSTKIRNFLEKFKSSGNDRNIYFLNAIENIFN